MEHGRTYLTSVGGPSPQYPLSGNPQVDPGIDDSGAFTTELDVVKIISHRKRHGTDVLRGSQASSVSRPPQRQFSRPSQSLFNVNGRYLLTTITLTSVKN